MALTCPRCRVPLLQDAADPSLLCENCSSRYPVVAGIPDLRLHPDPYIELAEDREKAERLAGMASELDLAGLIARYFELTPEVPPPLAARHVHGMLRVGPGRAGDRLDALEGEIPRLRTPLRVLDLGCGAGAWLPRLARRAAQLTAVDVGLRWLVVARKAAQEAGVEVELVCANAESLPFASCSFDFAVLANLLEHSRDARATVHETFRVLDKDGLAYLATPNRFSLLPEPHVGVPGLGLLPRRAADQLIRRWKGVPYSGITLRSAPSWRALAGRAGFRRVVVRPGTLGDGEIEALDPAARLGGRLVQATRRLPGAEALLTAFGPTLEVIAWKGPNRERIPVGREATERRPNPG